MSTQIALDEPEDLMVTNHPTSNAWIIPLDAYVKLKQRIPANTSELPGPCKPYMNNLKGIVLTSRAHPENGMGFPLA